MTTVKADEPVTLTPAAVFFIASAFVDFLEDKGLAQPKVGVGFAHRLSAVVVLTRATCHCSTSILRLDT